MRDSRITQIDEGTNGIQTLDLVRHKLIADGGTEIGALQAGFSELGDRLARCDTVAPMARAVQARLGEWRELTAEVLVATPCAPQEIGAMSLGRLQYSAYVLLASLWLQATCVAQAALNSGSGEGEFYRAKLASAVFLPAEHRAARQHEPCGPAGRRRLPDGAGRSVLRLLGVLPAERRDFSLHCLVQLAIKGARANPENTRRCTHLAADLWHQPGQVARFQDVQVYRFAELEVFAAGGLAGRT